MDEKYDIFIVSNREAKFMNIKEEKRKKFGQLLLEKKIVNESQIKEALEVQKTNGKALGDILIDLGYTTSGLIMS